MTASGRAISVRSRRCDGCRLTAAERETQSAGEKLKDDQEERWCAYLILGEIVRAAPTLIPPPALPRSPPLVSAAFKRPFGREMKSQADLALSASLQHPTGAKPTQ